LPYQPIAAALNRGGPAHFFLVVGEGGVDNVAIGPHRLHPDAGRVVGKGRRAHAALGDAGEPVFHINHWLRNIQPTIQVSMSNYTRKWVVHLRV
jgi:hypothetical protein